MTSQKNSPPVEYVDKHGQHMIRVSDRVRLIHPKNLKNITYYYEGPIEDLPQDKWRGMYNKFQNLQNSLKLCGYQLTWIWLTHSHYHDKWEFGSQVLPEGPGRLFNFVACDETGKIYWRKHEQVSGGNRIYLNGKSILFSDWEKMMNGQENDYPDFDIVNQKTNKFFKY